MTAIPAIRTPSVPSVVKVPHFPIPAITRCLDVPISRCLTSNRHPRGGFFIWEKSMTKQEVMEVILDCTGSLRHVPTLAELLEMTDVSHRNIIKHFGGYIGALQ